MLPAARFVTIELTTDCFYLFRYARDRGFAGDTLQPSGDLTR
jgi:hypothetical protein